MNNNNSTPGLGVLFNKSSKKSPASMHSVGGGFLLDLLRKAQELHDKEVAAENKAEGKAEGIILGEIRIYREALHMSDEEIIAEMLLRHTDMSREEIEMYVLAKEPA